MCWPKRKNKNRSKLTGGGTYSEADLADYQPCLCVQLSQAFPQKQCWSSIYINSSFCLDLKGGVICGYIDIDEGGWQETEVNTMTDVESTLHLHGGIWRQWRREGLSRRQSMALSILTTSDRVLINVEYLLRISLLNQDSHFRIEGQNLDDKT